ncbi:hypothetical protein GCM10010174_27250 [Kutzneria viridogrisea]|uniref:Uncharacterized protein n=1 Tax=Kutzneria viridogrisea TaxID=47990 RepID=A0ABR6BVB3_9PSEU|nr:hypothetical protein [Kutzneria viridogrisea]
MAERHPGWVTGITDSDARLATGLLIAPDASPVRALTGLRPAPGAPGLVAVKPGSNPVKLTLNPFQAVLQDQGSAAGGAYLVTLDSVVELTPDPPAASLNRIDLVVAEVTTTGTGFSVHLVTGTPASPPQRPALPNPTSLVLAQVTVFANGSQPKVDQQVPLTTALGGILPVAGAATRPQAPYQGMYLHRLDSNNLEFHDGTRWRTAVNTTNSGWVPLTLSANWVPFVPDQFPPPQVRRVGNLVQLRGMVQPTVDFPALSDASPHIGTFPSTMAPSYPKLLIAAAQPRVTGASTADGGWIQIAVVTNVVQLQFKNPQPAPKNFWISLETSWLVDDPAEAS